MSTDLTLKTSPLSKTRRWAALAVLSARLRVDTSSADVYVSTVGGARTVEPAIDLAMAISIVSSLKGVPPRPDLVVLLVEGAPPGTLEDLVSFLRERVGREPSIVTTASALSQCRSMRTPSVLMPRIVR